MKSSSSLTTNGVAAIFIHHTPKTTNRDTSEWEETEWMYSGSGVAGITNWARAYIAIDPRKGAPGVYKFSCTRHLIPGIASAILRACDTCWEGWEPAVPLSRCSSATIQPRYR
jgi:hypothetical protein